MHEEGERGNDRERERATKKTKVTVLIPKEKDIQG